MGYNSVADSTGLYILVAVVASQISETRNSEKILTYSIALQGHPKSSILVPIESAYATSY